MRTSRWLFAFVLAGCASPAPSSAPPKSHVATVEIPEGEPEAAPANAAAGNEARPSSDDLARCVQELRDGSGLSPAPEEARLYAEALGKERSGDLMSARKSYFELIQRHPRSPLMPLAYLAFGELFSAEAVNDPSKWPLAEQSYKEVIKYPAPQNTAYAYASLRLGESTKGDLPQVLSQMKRAVEATKQHPTLPCSMPVRARAKRAMVEVYAEAGQPSRAYAFFKPIADGDEDALGMLADLAERLRSGGKHREACEAARAKPSSAAGAPAARLDEIARGACKP